MEHFEMLLEKYSEKTEQLAAARAYIKTLEIKIDKMETTANATIGSLDTLNQFVNALIDCKKIEAIKLYRTLTGAFLKESKDAVEAVIIGCKKYPEY